MAKLALLIVAVALSPLLTGGAVGGASEWPPAVKVRFDQADKKWPGAIAKPSMSQRAIAASFKFADCSAQFISNEGHALTALHCLLSNLPNRSVRSSPSGHYSLLDIPYDARAEVIYPEGRSDVTLVVAGAGMIGHLLDGPYTLQEREEIRRYALSDFAILKFDRLPPGANCLQAAARPALRGEPVWSLGFPVRTYRGQGDSDGISRHLTVGRVASVQENGALDPEKKRFHEDIEGTPELVVTTLDIVPHMSGSMVLDAQGQMLGMNVKVLSVASADGEHVVMREIDSNGVAIALSAIYRQVAERLGADGARRIFDCR